jgi:hypothetical protein
MPGKWPKPEDIANHLSDEFLLDLAERGDAPAKVAEGAPLPIEDLQVVMKVVTYDTGALIFRR